MWTPAARGQMVEIARKNKRYPTDLTEEEWERIPPIARLLPGAAQTGRPPDVDLREVLNAIGDLARQRLR